MSHKIGIITFHRADNLGAVLQAYALQSVLEEMGKNVEIIDYYCPAIGADRVHASGVKGIALWLYYRIKHRGFEKFRKCRLHLSKPYTPETIVQSDGEYAAYISGSDQVWNYECSGYDDAYFLHFVTQGKKLSYAASLGRYRYSQEEQSRVLKLLSGFSAISVREFSAQRHLLELTEREVEVCPDPVILLSRDRWEQIMSKRLLRQKYVFVYLIMKSDEVLEAARQYAADRGYKVICNKTSPEFILRGAPEDFLSWIRHAECVFTNSFHGTAFSLLFGKRLAAYTKNPDGERNMRVTEILERTQSQSCALRLGAAEVMASNAAASLEKLRSDALRYLEINCSDL